MTNPTANNVDERREPLWDTLVVAKQTLVNVGTKLFTVGLDTRGRHLTNMNGNGELMSPERIDVYSIRIDFMDTPVADVEGLCKNFIGRLTVAGFVKVEAPLNYFVSGMANSGGSNGVADSRAALQFPDQYQIPIESGQKIYFELAGNPAGYMLTDVNTGLTMRVLLDGLHSVPTGS